MVSRATVAPPGLSALLGCRVLATVPRVDPPVVGSERIESTYDALATALAGTAAVPEKSRRIA
ncbi:hypothetical protein [Halobaculum litoreum]|uniref:hypothetical protein n=1 Tax=Halobaculum litoreum TaxID=3031998 RepID=UPI0024C280A6|nr:hypothetical protein [Halobaculum sp. DT92]